MTETKARLIASILDNTGDIKSTSLDNVSTGLTVYATLDDLPTSGLTSGQQAFVTSANRVYVSNGSGWYSVALFNATPRLTIDPTGAVVLATDGSTPTVITLTGTDSDNADASLIYSVESDGSFGGLATLSQDSSVFTITPLAEGSATTTSSTLTFKVSDGVSFGSGTTTFSLTFTPDWSSFNSTEDITNTKDPGYVLDFALGVTSTGNTVTFTNESTGTGAVYIMTRTGNTWSSKTTVGTGASAQLYGRSADISPNDKYLVVSDILDGTGKLHLYKKGTTWANATKVNNNTAFGSFDSTSNYGGNDIQFGGTSDEYLVVGNRYASTNGYANNGVIHVYWINPANDNVMLIGSLKSLSLNNGYYFGYSVGVSEDATTVIGAGNAGQELMIFDSTGNGSSRVYTQTQRITAPTTGKGFGIDCDISGDKSRIAVGGNTGGGICAIYYHNGSSWVLETELSLPASSAAFGYHVKFNYTGDILFVSDPFKGSGNIYVYNRSGSTWSLVNTITPSAGTYLGKDMDINRDGDMVMSNLYFSSPNRSGLAYYYV
jgi:hypothetical protein